MTGLGERIKSARTLKRISQLELANAIGRKQVSVSRVERGEIEPPYDQLKKIADALGVTMAHLLGEPKFVERLTGRNFKSEYESPIEPTPRPLEGEKIVIEKNGSRAEFPAGTSAEVMKEIIKSL